MMHNHSKKNNNPNCMAMNALDEVITGRIDTPVRQRAYSE